MISGAGVAATGPRRSPVPPCGAGPGPPQGSGASIHSARRASRIYTQLAVVRRAGSAPFGSRGPRRINALRIDSAIGRQLVFALHFATSEIEEGLHT
jgi:hypothetical protein